MVDSLWEAGTGLNSVVLKGSSGTASGDYSVAEGYQTIANEWASHTEGTSTSATSYQAHAEGYNTLASGSESHAEGSGSVAQGNSSHAEGQSTSATSTASHAEGYSTVASNSYEHASGMYNVSNTGTSSSAKTLFSVGNGTADNARHNAFEIRQNGDIYIVNKNGQDVRLQDEIGNITIDQVIDSTTSASTDAVSTSAVYGFVTSYTPSITVDQDFSNTASTNPISTKAVYDAVTDNELVWTNAYVTISGAISSHTEDTSIHVTAADKEKLHTHSNKSALDSITGNVGTMAYQNASSYSSATEVNTALGNKANTATTLAGYGITNAYTKSETSGATEISNALGEKVNSATFTGHTADTTVHFTTGTVQTQIDNSISGKVNTSDIISAITPSNSGSTAPIATKVVAENELTVSNALNDLSTNKADKSTTYTKTEIDDMIGDIETLLAAI